MSTDDSMNPMMNRLVLNRFFELCELPDLLKYRLVTKEWYYASLDRIRDEVLVKISADPNKKLNWSSFSQQLNVEGVPFRCFHAHDMDFVLPTTSSKMPPKYADTYTTQDLSDATNTSIAEIHKNMDRFWVENGQFIRKLTLEWCSVLSVEAFQKAVFEATPSLEELKLDFLRVKESKHKKETGENKDFTGRVHLNLNSLKADGLIGNFPLQGQHLFLHFPNLQKLKLKLRNDDELSLPLLLEACESLAEIPLKELILPNVKPSETITLKKLLSLRQLKLTKLELDVEKCEEEARSIIQVALRNQEGTLKKLIMDNCKADLKYDHSEYPTNNFPFRRGTFEKLTVLRLKGSVVCNNFNFIRQTPNLSELQIGVTVDEDFKTSLENVKTLVLPNLKILHIHDACAPVQQMEILAKIAPNVDLFHGVLDPSTLRVIFNNCWPKLKFLAISPLGIDDEVITGIKEGCAERLPNITNLKGLHLLLIDDDQEFGESSIWNGFLELPHLRFIFVKFSSNTSPEAIDALKQATDPESWDVEEEDEDAADAVAD